MLIYLAILETQEDQNLFTELYTSHKKKLFLTAKGILHDHGLAEDALHTAFLKIIDCLQKFYPLSCNERAYLCVTIVRNTALNMRRDLHMDTTDPLEEELKLPSDIQIEQDFLRVERMDEIMAAIASLDIPFSDVIKLRLVLGFSTEETAQMLDITPETVRVRLHRGRAQLIKRLKEGGITNE